MSNKNLPTLRSTYMRPIDAKPLKDPRMGEKGIRRDFIKDCAMFAGIPNAIVGAIMVFAVMVPELKASSLGQPVENGWTGIQMIIAWTVLLCAYLATFAVVYTSGARNHLASLDDRYLRDSRKRVHDVINRRTADSELEDHAFFARALIAKPDEQPYGRELLVRLDAIASKLEHAREAVSHDARLQERAETIAYKASMDLIRSIRAQAETGLDQNAVEDFARECQAIVDGRDAEVTQAAFAPTARIGRIISTAERMLQKAPDLTDAQGARVDDLVRTHVPRLLERHRSAAETASAKDIEAIDAQLDNAIEGIRASVQEAADAVHDEAMDALATELRFLELRRGTTPVLAAVS